MSNAPARVAPQQAVAAILQRYKPVVGKLLARTDTPPETFIAQIGTAMRANPDLWHCDPETVLGAALRCAQLNLAPNDGNSLAWIIPYKRTATFQLGYGGVLELVRRAAPGTVIDGRPVYPNDEFDIDYGRTPQLIHVPAACRRPPQSRGGDAFAWYVRLRYPNGSEQVHMLDREGVEYHRQFSKQPNGDMWTKSYDAAALKSVVLDMKRWLPHSAQLAAALSADDHVHDVRDMEQAGEIRHVPDDAPQIAAGADPEDSEWIAQASAAPVPPPADAS